MTKLIFVVSLAILPGIAFSQLSSLPPSSVTDGIPALTMGVNAGASHWEDPAALGAYRFASDGDLDRPNMKSPDNVLGLSWAAAAPASFSNEWLRINQSGGTIRMIFTGESAGWLNDFGYTYSGLPQGPDSFTAFQNISAVSPGETIRFGDHLDVSLAPGEAQTFDFWLNAVGSPGVNTPTPSDFGGVYTVIHPENSSPYVAPGNALWAQSPILVNTWIASLGAYADIATYLVGMEDWRRDRGSDGDSNDFFFALQLYERSGTPFDPNEVPVTPVPEPTTYGVIGAIGLLSLIGRRLRSKGRAPGRTASVAQLA